MVLKEGDGEKEFLSILGKLRDVDKLLDSYHDIKTDKKKDKLLDSVVDKLNAAAGLIEENYNNINKDSRDVLLSFHEKIMSKLENV